MSNTVLADSPYVIEIYPVLHKKFSYSVERYTILFGDMPHTIQSMVYLYIRYGQYICIVWDIFLHTMGISLYNNISLYCDSMGRLYIYIKDIFYGI